MDPTYLWYEIPGSLAAFSVSWEHVQQAVQIFITLHMTTNDRGRALSIDFGVYTYVVQVSEFADIEPTNNKSSRVLYCCLNLFVLL